MNEQCHAYRVDSPAGGAVVVFAGNNASARHRAAGQLDVTADEVGPCRRAPVFDAHAPGPVPAAALLERGWWVECRQSGEMLTIDDDPWCVGTRAYRSFRAWLLMLARLAPRKPSRAMPVGLPWHDTVTSQVRDTSPRAVTPAFAAFSTR